MSPTEKKIICVDVKSTWILYTLICEGMNANHGARFGIAVLFFIAVVIFVAKQGQLFSARTGAEESTKREESTSEAHILANGQSRYLEFSREEYQRAISAGKIIYLEFYANWCPICRAQEQELIQGFSMLTRSDVVGFRVNYKDDQTDDLEKELAEKYKIPYQHHKIVLKDGNVVIDTAETWDAQTLVEQLSKL